MENDGLIVGVLSSVLTRLIAINNKGGSNVLSLQPVTKFQSSYPPDVSIDSYLSRIHKYARCSESCFIVALIFIDRIIEKKNLVLSYLNIHRILIASVLISLKFMDDFFYNNAFYAKLGGISTQEMNALELELLLFLEFSLHVSTDVYASYYSELKSYLNADKIIPYDTLLYSSITNVTPPCRSPLPTHLSRFEIDNSAPCYQRISPSNSSDLQKYDNVHNINLSMDSSIALKRFQCQTVDERTPLVSQFSCPVNVDCKTPFNYSHHDRTSKGPPTWDNLINPNLARLGLVSTHEFPYRRVANTTGMQGIWNNTKEINLKNIDNAHHYSNSKNCSEGETYVGHAEQYLKRTLNFDGTDGCGFSDSFTQPGQLHPLHQPVQHTDEYYHNARYRLQPQEQLQQDFFYDENCIVMAHRTITPSYVNVSPSFLQKGNKQFRDNPYSASPSRSVDSSLGEFNYLQDIEKIQQTWMAQQCEFKCGQVNCQITGSSIDVNSCNAHQLQTSASIMYPLFTKDLKSQNLNRYSSSTRTTFSEKLPALSGHLPLLF